MVAFLAAREQITMWLFPVLWGIAFKLIAIGGVVGKKKGSGSDSLVGGAVLIGLFLLFALPTPVLVFLGVAGIGAGIWYWRQKPSSPPQVEGDSRPKPSSSPTSNSQRAAPRASTKPIASRSSTEIPVTVTFQFSSDSTSSTYRIPDAPPTYGDARWIPEGESVTVAGTTLPGGLFYVGTKLLTDGRQNDPCLIDPSKQVASRGNYAERQMGYWPHYGGIAPEARRAYLNWLAAGRKDSAADIGYVFLFFYGLERRVLVDSVKDSTLRAEWPAIRKELERLLAIYGKQSASFRRYASSLLMWLNQHESSAKTYLTPLPKLERGPELPFALRFALGQAALDKAPIPSHLALAWVRLAPMSVLRTAANRCADEFDRLFSAAYQRTFGDGMVIARNRTKLKLTHAPASMGFNGQIQVADIGDVPDVSVLTAPFKKIQDLVDSVTNELDSYSRFVGKNPEAANSLEGLLLLPVDLWPTEAQGKLQALKAHVGHGIEMMKLQEMLTSFGAQGALTKEKGLAFARALESLHIGIEPDVLGGAKLPKADEYVVLFGVSPEDATTRSTPAYKAALLTLQLASSVASADGDFCEKELEHLHEQVQSWTHLTPNHTRRLQAHLRLLQNSPVSLTALRSRLDAIDAQSKDAIATFMATVAQVDGTVSPEEVKLLEKLYKALGIDSKRVFSDVHAAASGGGARDIASAKGEQVGFKLDSARIAALQKDTEAVTALLSDIFKEDDVPSAIVEEEVEESVTNGSLLGLDDSHTVLARLLLSRSEWARQELGDAAADLELMLDGALETINEAAFDAHDIPFIEGEDPITVNPELVEKLAA